MEACGGAELRVQSLFTSKLGGERSASRTGRFTPRGSPGTYYRCAPHNDVSVNGEPHIRRWYHNIILYYIILYYIILYYIILYYIILYYIITYHCVTTIYSIQYSNRFVA